VDIELAHEMLAMFVHRFETDAQFDRHLFVGLAFGNQLEHFQLTRTQARNFLSQYKNLVHHYYHHREGGDADTFWAGCGAVRKDIFLASGGFDALTYRYPSIEDIELGFRLRQRGLRVVLAPEVQGTHLKVWRLGNLLHTDIFRRAVPWSRLIHSRSGLPDALNVGVGERINAALPADGFHEAVLERAKRLAHAAPIALRLAKEALLAGLERSPGKGYEVEAENFGKAAMTEDAMVGIMSFVSKQQPDFKGK